MSKFRRKAKKSLLGALSLLSAFSSVAPMSAMNNKENGEVGINVDYDDDDLSGYDADDEREEGVSPETKKTGLSTAAKIGIGVGAGSAAALGIGLLASYLSKSDGEIGKKITIEDIDLRDRYNNGKIDGLNMRDKISSANMKQRFPNSQSKIKDGFLYEYLGGKEFKVIDIYLNYGESRVYLGADIKNSPTLKNINESNGNAIDSKAYYRVTNTNGSYTIVKSDAPNLNPVPVQNPLLPPVQPGQPGQFPNPLQQPPVAPQPALFSAYDIDDMMRKPDHGLDVEGVPRAPNEDVFRSEHRDGMLHPCYLYKIDGNKVVPECINYEVMRSKNIQSFTFNSIRGSVLLKSEKLAKRNSNALDILPDLNYAGELYYNAQLDIYTFSVKLVRGQIITAKQAVDSGLVDEEPDAKFYNVIENGNLEAVYDIYSGSEPQVPAKIRGFEKNPGLLYRFINNEWMIYDVNKDYVKNQPVSINLAEATFCISLIDCTLPSSSLKVRDFYNNDLAIARNANRVVNANGATLLGAKFSVTFDGKKFHIDWVDPSLPGDLFIKPAGGNFNWMDKFRIYKTSDYDNSLQPDEKRAALIGHRVKYDKDKKKLVIVSSINSALSDMEREKIRANAEEPPLLADNNFLLTEAEDINLRSEHDDISIFMTDDNNSRTIWDAMLFANKLQDFNVPVPTVRDNMLAGPVATRNLYYNDVSNRKISRVTPFLKSDLCYIRKYYYTQNHQRFLRFELIKRKGNRAVVTQYDFAAGTENLPAYPLFTNVHYGPNPNTMLTNGTWHKFKIPNRT